MLLTLLSPRVVQDPLPVEVLHLDSHDRARVQRGVRSADGRIIVETDAFAEVFASGLVLKDRDREYAAVERLEGLINDEATQEADLQDFFEEHPEFLLGAEYEDLYPHVVLARPEGDLIPDFILKPVQGMSHEPAIVDLKLPSQSVIKPTPRRPGLYSKVHEGVSQLHTYHGYFAEKANRDYVHEQLGFTTYDPKLVLVVGRALEVDDPVARSQAVRQARPVELMTYEDVLRRQKRLLDSPHR